MCKILSLCPLNLCRYHCLSQIHQSLSNFPSLYTAETNSSKIKSQPDDIVVNSGSGFCSISILKNLRAIFFYLCKRDDSFSSRHFQMRGKCCQNYLQPYHVIYITGNYNNLRHVTVANITLMIMKERVQKILQ